MIVGDFPPTNGERGKKEGSRHKVGESEECSYKVPSEREREKGRERAFC